MPRAGDTNRPADGCSIEGCDRPSSTKGLCKLHYERQRLGQQVDAPIRTFWRDLPLSERLLRQSILTPSGCIEWTGTINKEGYAIVKYQGRSIGAHRAAYFTQVGPIPTGWEVDHVCRNRRCINIEHLEAVTKRENILRSDNFVAINARKTHCHRGHEFTQENTAWLPGNRRECKACRKITRAADDAPPHGIQRPLRVVR